MSKNPFQSPEDTSHSNIESNPPLTSSRAAYNVVADTVTGVNVRWSDNRFQAIFVAVSTVLTTIFGAFFAAFNTAWNLPWYGGALLGSLVGLVLGTFASGIFLMFYRAIRHFKSQHD